MQNLHYKMKANKILKKLIRGDLGLHLGRVWDGLGTLWASLGPLFLVFWTFKIELFPSMGPRWAPRDF